MPVLTRFQKYAIIGIGSLGGTAFFYANSYGDREHPQVTNSWTTNFTPSVKWDSNWDRRDPKCLVKPMKSSTVSNEVDENKLNEAYEAKKPKAVRHLILIRHGQYNLEGKTDAERTLTELGRRQADSTGARLAELGLPYTLLVKSTMSRAQETAKIIEKHLPGVPAIEDGLLIEGAPIPPEPPLGHWKSERYFYEDGPRIEAAFRRYFHRADYDQEKDSYTILVCHANVIRYFVCRALQFPPEAWLRISLKNASITWLSIVPSGRVTLRCLGDAGHMVPQNLTTT
ncbi:serine/threonine-protein phosphatase PGAM5, mitochondrial [Venturia canescens]|uniref:serine/threonine-protein phosphatase PGAM5, mitochondrial n=1 Tax=Venturia canescens TaxID=32260 RepID=UPI001C9D38A9|nr:serine/threonine-protein phosphatase PGAM5, mitochondrial [Venturia canescens]